VHEHCSRDEEDDQRQRTQARPDAQQFGIGLGIAMTRALADRSIESIALPGGQLLASVALGGVAGVLAGIGPARRAVGWPHA
jgi:hypothetical protein